MRERCFHERNTCTWQQMTFRKIRAPSRQERTTFQSLRTSLVSCYNSRCNTPSPHKIITVIIIASVKLSLLILFAFCAKHRMSLVVEMFTSIRAHFTRFIFKWRTTLCKAFPFQLVYDLFIYEAHAFVTFRKKEFDVSSSALPSTFVASTRFKSVDWREASKWKRS